jgi:hypothetical protein
MASSKRVRLTFAGLPPTIAYGGTSVVTNHSVAAAREVELAGPLAAPRLEDREREA